MFGGEGPVLVVQPPTARGESEEGSRRSGSTRSGETRSGGGEKSDSVVRSEGGNEGREGGKEGAKRKKDKKGEGSEGEVESETEWRRESRKEGRPSQNGSKRDGKGEKGSPALSNSGSRRERSTPPSPIVIVEPSAEEEGEERNTSSPSIAPSSQSPMEKSQRGGHGKGGGKASARTPPTRRTRSPSAASPSAMKSRRERGEGAKKGDSGSEDEIAPSSPLSTPAIAIQQRPATVAEGVRRSPAGGSGSSGLKSPPLPYEGTTWSPARTRRKADDDGGDALRAAAQGLRVSANSSEMGSDESEKKKKKKRRKKKASKPPVLVAIEKLEDECDLYTKKLEEERMRMKKLKVEITAAEDEILKFRLKLKGGQDAMDNQISSKEKAVATLEEKLGQMRAKLNERIKSNKVGKACSRLLGVVVCAHPHSPSPSPIPTFIPIPAVHFISSLSLLFFSFSLSLPPPSSSLLPFLSPLPRHHTQMRAEKARSDRHAAKGAHSIQNEQRQVHGREGGDGKRDGHTHIGVERGIESARHHQKGNGNAERKGGARAGRLRSRVECHRRDDAE
mmetsp:Transcript_36288/g.94377  ORF Transcript_36288/g.94377 Transcript_36288/m.94377 type:complete len:562 (-) Transcript_36288:1057-2742(-)